MPRGCSTASAKAPTTRRTRRPENAPARSALCIRRTPAGTAVAAPWALPTQGVRHMDTRTVFGKLSPPITKMIRMDHSHVMVTSHKFTSDASPDTKKAIVESVCLALTIHAQLEEEIFYPALREVDGGNEALAKAKPEHD